MRAFVSGPAFCPTLGRLALLSLSLSLPGRANFISTLQEVSPAPTSFVFGVDQTSFQYVPVPGNGIPDTGQATAPLFLASNMGCNASDFSGFPSGDIALILRQGCTFTTKGTNAENAGASGYVVFNNFAGPLPLGTLVLAAPPPGIPGVFVTNSVGLMLEGELSDGEVVDVSLSVESTPEPISFALCALAIALVLGVKRIRAVG
jgi:hypothetical protein